ncbi:hypothetical protein [Flavobacterium sp. FlaQc-47]|uniref:hypothetical protein n=1 Tax=Flavobacterium sp. FlaQc-47 TaxID=3374180 RepID=UPI003756710B
MLDIYIQNLENIMKDLSMFEKKGLDTSSLRLFVKNLKTFQKLQQIEESRYGQQLSFDEKLSIIKTFLEDKKAFPTIKNVIEFANNELSLSFIDQKESRDITIRRILSRIEETPELKEKVKKAVINIRNQTSHKNAYKSKREMESAVSFSKWAEILRNL